MITSSTTSSSSWKCLKVNIRTTIVVASVVSHPDIFVSSITSSFHHYSTLHPTWSNWCVNKLRFHPTKKSVVGKSLYIPSWKFSSLQGGFPTPGHFYILGTQATREESQIFTSAFLHCGPSETRPTWWWSKPGVRSGEQHLKAGGNRMIEKIMRSLVCLSFSKKAVNTTCLNHHL